jgi:hypothetical protein
LVLKGIRSGVVLVNYELCQNQTDSRRKLGAQICRCDECGSE